MKEIIFAACLVVFLYFFVVIVDINEMDVQSNAFEEFTQKNCDIQYHKRLFDSFKVNSVQYCIIDNISYPVFFNEETKQYYFIGGGN